MTRICLACMRRGCSHHNRRLSPRQEEILRLALQTPPLSHKELAYLLAVEMGTLNEHLNRLYRKLGFGGTGSFVQVVLWAHDHRELLDKEGVAERELL